VNWYNCFLATTAIWFDWVLGMDTEVKGYYMNDEQRAAHFVPIILSVIRRDHVEDKADFIKIIQNDIVIPELVKHYGYFHMFGYEHVVQMLSEKEPLIKT
jgi:hypothetical protein